MRPPLYLVIQDGVDRLEDAKDIQEFLRTKGIRAEVEPSERGRTYQVRDVSRPFRYTRSSEAIDYQKSIEGLGAKYKATGKRYDFRGTFFHKVEK